MYDAAAVSAAYFTIVPQFSRMYNGLGVIVTGLSIAVNVVVRGIGIYDLNCVFEKKGTVGPLLIEVAIYPLKKLGQAAAHLNEEARKNLEVKKRLLLAEHKEE